MAAALFAKGKWQLIGFMFIMLTCWAMFIWLYPKMVIETPKEEMAAKYYIPIPGTPCAISMLFLLLATESMNDNTNSLFLFTVIYMCVLLIPYSVLLLVRKPKVRFGRFLSVLIAVFALAYTTARPLNIAATVQAPVHETVSVISTDKSRGSAGTNYSAVVEWQGTEQKMRISKYLYDSIGEDDEVQVCKKMSIFGYTYWTLH